EKSISPLAFFRRFPTTQCSRAGRLPPDFRRYFVRSLFWRVFASFWLAIALVAGLSWLLGHALNQDTWIISRHPGLKDLASEWVQLRETKGELASYSRLERLR